MSRHIADEVSAFCAQASVERFPADVVDKAKVCLVDFLSAALMFDASREARIALKALEEPGARGYGSVVLGASVRASAPMAAYLASVAAAATGRTDTHIESSSHPGMVVVPALLALSEHVDVPGGRLLSALVVGYEVMCRLGSALITPEVATVFRPTGLIGPVAAAAACAHLLALGREATRAALSMAANASFGLNQWARSGTPEHVLHSAVAARAGVESALLARHGLTAAVGGLDGDAGLLAAFKAGHRAHHLTDRLGTRFAIRDIVHKPAPACIYVQGPCQLAQDIVQRHRPDPRRIDSVLITLPEQAVRYPGCDNAGPIADVLAGSLSVQFSVGSVLVAGGIFDRNWQDPRDTEVNRLAARSRLVEDPGLTAAFPARNGSSVRVLLDDGRTLVAEQDTFASMTTEEVIARFHLAADPIYGRAGSQAIADRIDELDRSASLSGLLRALQAR
ncbi:MmgE/PrpD family protein [Streptomyces sp. NPDC044780]